MGAGWKAFLLEVVPNLPSCRDDRLARRERRLVRAVTAKVARGGGGEGYVWSAGSRQYQRSNGTPLFDKREKRRGREDLEKQYYIVLVEGELEPIVLIRVLQHSSINIISSKAALHCTMSVGHIAEGWHLDRRKS